MDNRKATLERNTKETQIRLALALDVKGQASDISTGLPFFDHMLNAFARHGHFALVLQVKGDLEVDAHHTMEDVGLALGQALKESLGDKRGITRFGSALVPLDESLARMVIDLSGRPFLGWRTAFPQETAGGVSVRMFHEFFQGLVNAAGMTLHADLLFCEENHHGLEAMFKAFGRALRQAVDFDPCVGDAVPSTKGIL